MNSLQSPVFTESTRCDAAARRSEAKASRRIYDEAVCEAIVVPREASDRICGKRLKALMPILVEAMERHGHPGPGPEIRAAVLAMSASTIDRSLREVREQASGRKRRRTAAPSSVRKSIPVRNFSDWDDPPPGFVEADLVAHCGPVANGSFVRTPAVTDIATGWTGCAPLPYREQTLLGEVLGEVRTRLPFEPLGFDTDNDSVLVNETVRDYCRPDSTDPAAEADAGAATATGHCGHRRQAVCRAVEPDRTAARAIPCRIAHRVAGRRSKAHGHTGGEAEARPTEARSAGEGDGAAARLVRGRAVA